MRTLLVIALMALTGCSASRPSAIPPQPNAATDPNALKQVGEALDARSGKVAAAVTVAVQNKDKPAVVEAEGRLALSFLPAPTEGDLAIAKARAAKADQKDYAAAEAAGKKAVADLAASLAKAKADQSEALRVSQLKDKRIADLTAALKESEESANKSPLRVSAGFCFLAALGLAIVGQYLRAGACVTLGGILIGISTILSSPWLIWSLIATVVVVLGLGVWVVFDMARDKVNEKPSDDEPPQA